MGLSLNRGIGLGLAGVVAVIAASYFFLGSGGCPCVFKSKKDEGEVFGEPEN